MTERSEEGWVVKDEQEDLESKMEMVGVGGRRSETVRVGKFEERRREGLQLVWC